MWALFCVYIAIICWGFVLLCVFILCLQICVLNTKFYKILRVSLIIHSSSPTHPVLHKTAIHTEETPWSINSHPAVNGVTAQHTWHAPAKCTIYHWFYSLSLRGLRHHSNVTCLLSVNGTLPRTFQRLHPLLWLFLDNENIWCWLACMRFCKTTVQDISVATIAEGIHGLMSHLESLTLTGRIASWVLFFCNLGLFNVDRNPAFWERIFRKQISYNNRYYSVSVFFLLPTSQLLFAAQWEQFCFLPHLCVPYN